jgi:hypothetical protein
LFLSLSLSPVFSRSPKFLSFSLVRGSQIESYFDQNEDKGDFDQNEDESDFDQN